MASTTIIRVRSGCSSDDDAVGIRVEGVNLSASFLLQPAPLGMRVHVVKGVGGKKHIAPKIRIEKYTVAHGNGRSITMPS